MKKNLIAKYTNKSGKTEEATDNCYEVLNSLRDYCYLRKRFLG